MAAGHPPEAIEKTPLHTTWNVISNLKVLQDFARKIPFDGKRLTANIPSRVH
jgi:hypothetical protein